MTSWERYLRDTAAGVASPICPFLPGIDKILSHESVAPLFQEVMVACGADLAKVKEAKDPEVDQPEVREPEMKGPSMAAVGKRSKSTGKSLGT